ncbi:MULTISPECIES: hypothetical protein [unclassified Vibrio]|uniref:hypothetical protein n=1 Tax=unclassified Vibrio TaxID=2614977 RepID=UPI000B8E6542|nr:MULTISPECIES: hypothetical protein [unclassified Vibrio]NAX43790.1 hypothetical protein [Vibrio sp. V25_P4S6T154]OXX42679.1 hypothetical protein B9J93_17115 [Vibrio sp. V17_P4S1T151]OXX59211.1 hypothetical protein B9J89_19705 [Vibrio sp. V15_P4S5T153]OXX72126.1 hypothetical protein B9J94_00105 [Vibrio sp. V20_P4S3T152]
MSLEPVILNEVQLKSAETQAKIDTQTQVLTTDNATKRDEINTHVSAESGQTIAAINSETATKLAEQTTTLQQTITDSEAVVALAVSKEATRVIDSLSGSESGPVMIGQGVLLPESGVDATYNGMRFLLSGAVIANPAGQLASIASPNLNQTEVMPLSSLLVSPERVTDFAYDEASQLGVAITSAGGILLSKNGNAYTRKEIIGFESTPLSSVVVHNNEIHVAGYQGLYAVSVNDGATFTVDNSVKNIFGTGNIFGLTVTESMISVFGAGGILAVKREGGSSFTQVLTGTTATLRRGYAEGGSAIIGTYGGGLITTSNAFLTVVPRDISSHTSFVNCYDIVSKEDGVYLLFTGASTSAFSLLYYPEIDASEAPAEVYTHSGGEDTANVQHGASVNGAIYVGASGSAVGKSPVVRKLYTNPMRLVATEKITPISANDYALFALKSVDNQLVISQTAKTSSVVNTVGFTEYTPNLYMRYE